MIEEPLYYIDELEEDIKDKEKLGRILNETNLINNIDPSEYLSYHQTYDILHRINDYDVREYLTSESYKVFDKWSEAFEDLSEICDQDILDEVENRGLENEILLSLHELGGDKLKRHLCDILECGFFQHTTEELLKQLKQKIDK